MSNGRKAQIKKLIADLHADPKKEQASKEHQVGQSQNVKAFGGAKKSGTYRPKI